MAKEERRAPDGRDGKTIARRKRRKITQHVPPLSPQDADVKGGLIELFDELHRLLDDVRVPRTDALRNAGRKMVLQHEIAEGKCNPVTFEQLFLDIVTLVFSTYMFLPAINQIARLGKAEMDALLKRRHEEILTLIYLRLYGKDPVKG